MMWAELHQVSNGQRVMIDPASVMAVWEPGEHGDTAVVLKNGDRVVVREPYPVVSARLHEAAQAGVAA